MSEIPEGATHWGQGEHCKFWIKDLRPGISYQFANARNGGGYTSWMIRNCDPLYPITPISSAWTGETPPPVGIDVEIHNDNDYGICAGAKSFIGSDHEVKAVFANANGTTIVAVEDSSGACMCFRSDMCRPVRTPEQIAAEERERTIENIREIARCAIAEGHPAADAVYDAGYRKIDVK